VSISTADIKSLREATGAGPLDCKKALQETNGDVDAAIEFLRKKGLASASKKTSREANDGLVTAFISPDGKVGAMVEVNCETDFVARTDDFKNFVASVLKLVVSNPTFTSPEALLAAPSASDAARTNQELMTELIAKLGENMILRRVARFNLDDSGLIDSYIHMGGRVGVLVEATGVALGDSKALAVLHDVALQIAAAAPQFVTIDEVPAAMAEAEKELYRGQMAEEKKPADVKERIIEGKLKKWYTQVVLNEQEFVKDNSLSMTKLLKSHSDNFQIRRFARFELGTN